MLRGQAVFWSNRPGPKRRVLSPGVYGLSNGALDEPWPKTLRLKDVLAQWIDAGAVHPQVLLDGLREDALLAPDGPPVAPSDVPQEPPLSPIFIRNPVYGTRCSTVTAIDQAGRGLIVERRFNAAGEPEGETTLSFSWPWESGRNDRRRL